MLFVIPHHPENWQKHSALCMKCGQNDARTGLCHLGIHHGNHVNAGYCPQGDFGPGSDVKPEVWPTEIEARIQTCRGCVAQVKNHCGNDGASILEHARRDICPMGNYGTAGTIEKPMAAEGIAPPARGKCCGG